ncbi:hypothetical protein ACFV23_01395, partial [Streptomyces sp. NPDC059627]
HSANSLQFTRVTPPEIAAMVYVTGPTAGGYAVVYPTAVGQPTAGSNLNWGTGDTLANLTLTPTDTNGQISIYNNSDGTADFIVDSSGYYT